MKQISNGKELDALIKFFNLLLAEDVANFNQNTNKYVLIDKKGEIVQTDATGDINEYLIGLLNTSFDSVSLAEINQKNVLNYYTIQMKLLLEKQKKNTQPTINSQI